MKKLIEFLLEEINFVQRKWIFLFYITSRSVKVLSFNLVFEIKPQPKLFQNFELIKYFKILREVYFINKILYKPSTETKPTSCTKSTNYIPTQIS